jgi:hypothetical protein
LVRRRQAQTDQPIIIEQGHGARRPSPPDRDCLRRRGHYLGRVRSRSGGSVDPRMSRRREPEHSAVTVAGLVRRAERGRAGTRGVDSLLKVLSTLPARERCVDVALAAGMERRVPTPPCAYATACCSLASARTAPRESWTHDRHGALSDPARCSRRLGPKLCLGRLATADTPSVTP